jgi:hypothetical protein
MSNRSIVEHVPSPTFAARATDALQPVRATERLVALSMMIAASAVNDDSDRLMIVAHRYMRGLIEHLESWGRARCDEADGLMLATIQLGLLVNARRVISSATRKTPAAVRAQQLVELTEHYNRTVRKHAAAHGDH